MEAVSWCETYVREQASVAIVKGTKEAKGGSMNPSELYDVMTEGVTGMMNRAYKKGFMCDGQLTDRTMMLTWSVERAMRGTGILTARTAAGRDQGVMRVEVNVCSVALTLSSPVNKACVRDCTVVRGGGLTRPPYFDVLLRNMPIVEVGNAVIAGQLDLRRIGAVPRISPRPSAGSRGRRVLGPVGVRTRRCRRTSGACHRRGSTYHTRG